MKMKFSTIFICIILIPTSFSKTYKMFFPKSDQYPYAKLLGSIDRSLEEFTLCYWTRLIGEIKGTPFSYSTADIAEVISMFLFPTYIYINQMEFRLSVYVTSAQWFHVCLASTTVNGATATIFINGTLVYTSKNHLKPGTPILPNGLVVLGQEVRKSEEGFDPLYKFHGEIADVFMWDHILSPKKVAAIYRCTRTEDANVINWNVQSWQLFNGIRVSSITLPCEETF